MKRRSSFQAGFGAALACSVSMGCQGEISGLGESGGGDRAGVSDPAGGGAGSVVGIDDPNGIDPNDPQLSAPVEFACETGAEFVTPPMRRLTKRQYENTIGDLVERAVGASDRDAILGTVQPLIDDVPEDVRRQLAEDLHGSYRRLDQDVTQAHVEAWYAVATAVGSSLTGPQRLETVVGSCATDSDTANDESCIDDFIERFGALAFRRPLTPTEVAEQRAYYAPSVGIDPIGFADLIAGILSAPQFLYLIEHGGTEISDSPGTFQLDAFELASRLSYHFWETMPDAELFDSARTDALLQLDEYQRQLDRLFTDPRTRTTLREFSRDWLKLDDLANLTKNVEAPLYQAFAGSNLPSDSLRDHMIDEVLDLIDYYTWTDPVGLSEILTTDRAFARTDDLAELYGVPIWDGTSTPPAFPAGERPGVLTRAAFLATGTAMTRPIMRGVFVRTNVLCDEIPPPPDNAAANQPELSDTLSTRQVVEALTQTEGTPCAACHATRINPIGFAFELYDALGRTRNEQTLFDANGSITGRVPIDTSTTPQIVSRDQTPSSGPADLMRLIVDSGKAHACLARHYFRFSFGRWESVKADGCVLEAIRTSLTESGNVAQMLKDVAATDAFRQRTFD
jgi:hypothetical protein